ncbi:hypothetical protein [Parageobacillus thermoglucosidasius]
MHRKGLSWTRPTYTLAKGDPDRQKKLRETNGPDKKT